MVTFKVLLDKRRYPFENNFISKYFLNFLIFCMIVAPSLKFQNILMLFTQLKERTLPVHQQTEKILINKLKNIKSIHDYIHILKIFLSFYDPLEKLIAAHVNTDIVKDYHHRKKTAYLIKDLQSLNSNISISYATNSQLPKIKSNLDAIGALYVLEGSTLGGIIIAAMLSKVLKLETGLSFFNCYGEQTHYMWQHFQVLVNNGDFNKQDKEIIIDSAVLTFETFKEFLTIHDR